MVRYRFLGSLLSEKKDMLVHPYTNWNLRPSDHEEQMEPFGYDRNNLFIGLQ